MTLEAGRRGRTKVDASGVVSGTFRQVGTSTPKGNGWGGQMKHVIDAKLAGGAGNAISIVGKISTGGTITYKGNGIPLASTKPYRAWLGPTSASCNVVGSKYWTARRVAGTGKPPAAATIKQTEQNALLALDRAQPVSRDLRSVTGWLYKLNFQIEAARRCGVAPVGYARGLAGRADIVRKLRDLLKSLVGQGAQYSGYGLEPYDVVDFVNSAVDTGAIGDTTVKQGLETWMDQA